MNSVLIAGHLGIDPEVRYSPEGKKRSTFTVATNERRNGKDSTTWWRVTVFGDQFDKLMSYLKKGSSVIISGKLRFDENGKLPIYTDKNGQPQASLEIIATAIDFAPSSGNRERTEQQSSPYTAGNTGNNSSHQAQPFSNQERSYGSDQYGNSYGGNTPSSPSSSFSQGGNYQDDDMPF